MMAEEVGANRYMSGDPLPEGGLLQSREWGRFLVASGKDYHEIRIGDRVYNAVREKLPIVGCFLYIPRLMGGLTQEMRQELEREARNLGCVFVRADLTHLDEQTHQNTSKFHKAPSDVQPRENFIIDIDMSLEDILSRMKSKTRYKIRLAEKKGVKVESYTYGDEGFEGALREFYALVEMTARRKSVRFHRYEHYKMMFASLPTYMLRLSVARYDGIMLGANVVSYHSHTATYLHGATSSRYRNYNAPFLLQWQSICDAKEKKHVYYDFGGFFSDSKDAGKQGISRFKESFSPETRPIVSAGTWDIVCDSRRYNWYMSLRKVRSFFRR